MLANAGHDVWLANGRGTRYSNKHVTFSIEENEYWDFRCDLHLYFFHYVTFTPKN